MDDHKRWQQALASLRSGDYSSWPKHEWIRAGSQGSELTPTFGMPIWKGERGTVLVNADCGMGDTICYYRWLHQIDDVVLRCDADFEDLFPIPINHNSAPVAEADYIINMLAVPGVLGIKSVSGEPYLSPASQNPFASLTQMGFDKIGICWAGNPFNQVDPERSIPVELFNFWGDFKPFGLVKHEPTPEFMLDARGYMVNWLSTANLVSVMDLVITVDTAIAHLAGALGVKTWLLLPERVDWRWHGSEETTPWYSSVRIFRKTSTWEELLEEVRITIESQGLP
jgi:hypothetical protein